MKSKWFGLFLLVNIFLIPCLALSVEIEPKVMYSIMQVRDNGDMHKNNMVGLGLSLTGGKKYYWEVTPEIWSATQNGFETAAAGYSVFSQVGYRLHYGKLEVIPVIGPYTGRWERGGNAKFSNSWTYINYLDAAYGVDLNYKLVYAKLNLIHPLVYQSNVNVSIWQDPREYLEAGIRINNLSIGLLRRTWGFQKIDNNLYMHGIQVGYRF